MSARGAGRGRGDRGGFQDRGGRSGDRGGGGRGGGYDDRGPGRGDNFRGAGRGAPGGGRGGPPQVYMGSGGRVPPPSTEATAIENAFQKNLSDGSPNVGQLSLKQQHPIRPGYGTRGEEVILFANYFELVTAPDLVLYRYSFQIKPEEKGKKLAQVVRLLLELPEYTAIKDHLVTDFKSTLISRKRLEKTENEHRIQYRMEGEDDARNNATTYLVTVQETGILSVAQLTAFLTSTSVDLGYTDKQPIVQALNIFMGHFSKASTVRATVGANKSFALQNADMRNLGAGLTAIRGFFSSVRVAASRILVNINVTHAPFYKPVPLIELMREFGEVHQRNLWKTEKFLKRLRVKIVHIPERTNKAGRSFPRIKTISGLASPDDGRGSAHPPRVKAFGAGANQVEFFLNDSTGPLSGTPSASSAPSGQGGGKRDGKKKKEKQVSEPGGQPSSSGGPPQGRYISVYDYFKKTYPKHPIQNPGIPVVNVGTRENPSYLPVDVCKVEPGQSSSSKLSPQQTKEMIAFAVRKPFENARSIVDAGPGTVGMLPQLNPTVVNFGISMNGELITVPGRILPPPKVNYKANSADVRDGSWNMLKVKFNTAGKSKKWTTMIISEQGVHQDYPNQIALKPTIEKFYSALTQIGVEISAPQPGPPPFMVNSPSDFPRIDANLKSIVAKGFELVFVVLPTDNTPAYDYLKTAADTKYGLHTICSVSSKLVKEQSQYFNNVALKFNLKLGGINQLVDSTRLGIINEGKIMVVGIDVTHPSPGSASNAPSVAAMVASVDKWLGQWPATLRVQRGRDEMVADLGSMFQSRLALWKAKNKVFPENILVYRDGVSEGQYDLVLNEELPLLRAACADLYPAPDTKKDLPHFTIIICGKRHHTRFYATDVGKVDKSSNPRNGTVVDRGVTEPHLWDFYLQAHTALQGTARSCHYIVVLDEVLRKRKVGVNAMGYRNTADVLEDMTYCMCHLFGRATKTVSLCPPAKYADIVCERARKYLSGLFDASSLGGTQMGSEGGRGDASNEDVQVHAKLRDTMFYL